MFPIGGILGGARNDLLVPGETVPAVWTGQMGFPGTAYAGARFNTQGSMHQRGGVADYVSWDPDSWIHGDSWDSVDASLYECRYTSVTGGGTDALITPGGAWSVGTETTWYAISEAREWYVTATGGEFGFQMKTVIGTIEVREIAVPANIKSGTLTLTATFEGDS